MYNAKEGKEQTMLSPDAILDGTIKEIKDGIVKDFVHDTSKWQGSVDQPAINIQVEVNNTNGLTFEQLFTYNNEGSSTTFAPNSNLGKYKKKYNKLPEVGDNIKVATNSDGFGKIKLD